MGGVKKVFKSVGKVFGIGGSSHSSAAPTIDTTPVQQNVVNQDVSLANDSIANETRKKNKYKTAIAMDAGDTIVGGAGSDDSRDVTGA